MLSLLSSSCPFYWEDLFYNRIMVRFCNTAFLLMKISIHEFRLLQQFILTFIKKKKKKKRGYKMHLLHLEIWILNPLESLIWMAYEDQWYLFLTILVVLVATYSIWIILVTPPPYTPNKKKTHWKKVWVLKNTIHWRIDEINLYSVHVFIFHRYSRTHTLRWCHGGWVFEIWSKWGSCVLYGVSLPY